jgi:ssRNA-specific RNase YbeY (16S rRNA maturation enzyme)
LPFSLSKPQKALNFKWGRRLSGYSVSDLQVEVDALSEGKPAGLAAAEVEELLDQLQQDAEQAVPLALQAKRELQPTYRLPAIANLSLVLCDDAHIQQLNKEYRNKDAPTDVLSFEIPDEAPGLQLPVKLLGDLVISLDTARRQADERGCVCRGCSSLAGGYCTVLPAGNLKHTSLHLNLWSACGSDCASDAAVTQAALLTCKPQPILLVSCSFTSITASAWLLQVLTPDRAACPAGAWPAAPGGL